MSQLFQCETFSFLKHVLAHTPTVRSRPHAHSKELPKGILLKHRKHRVALETARLVLMFLDLHHFSLLCLKQEHAKSMKVSYPKGSSAWVHHYIPQKVASWGTNPSEKYARQIGFIFPQISG